MHAGVGAWHTKRCAARGPPAADSQQGSLWQQGGDIQKPAGGHVAVVGGCVSHPLAGAGGKQEGVQRHPCTGTTTDGGLQCTAGRHREEKGVSSKGWAVYGPNARGALPGRGARGGAGHGRLPSD